MIDIREHGGGYGGGKYKKGYSLNLNELNMEFVSDRKLYSVEASQRFDAICIDANKNIYVAGYNTTSGVNRIYRILPLRTPTNSNIDYWSPSSVYPTYRPISVVSPDNSPYLYVQEQNSYRVCCYNKDMSGGILASVSGEGFMVSSDGNKVFVFNAGTNKLLVYNSGLTSLLQEFSLLYPVSSFQWNFIKNRYFVHKAQNTNKLVKYDLENLFSMTESSGGISDNFNTIYGEDVNVIHALIANSLYIFQDRKISEYNFNTMNKVREVTVNIVSSGESIVTLRDTKNSGIEMFINNSGTLKIAYIDKTTLWASSYPNIIASTFNMVRKQYDASTGSWVMTSSDNGWYVKKLYTEFKILK